MAAADLARVLVVAQRARTAADSAALAAAQELALPSDADPADAARDYAARNGASLTSCTCDAGSFEADVSVLVPVGPLLLFGDGRWVAAEARAVVDGPVA
jgi:Flp pilus assembly protein TadG